MDQRGLHIGWATCAVQVRLLDLLPLIQHLCLAMAQSHAVTVSSALDLQHAIKQGSEDISLLSHIDARQLQSTFGPTFLVTETTRSIQGNCTGQPATALTRDLKASELIPFKAGQCLILGDSLLFEFRSTGSRVALQSLYLRMQRVGQDLHSGIELMAFNGAAVWMTNMTIQGDGPQGSALALKPFSNAQVFVSASTIQDWNGTVGPVALIENNSSLVFDMCVIKDNTNTANRTAILARRISARTSSTVILRDCSLSGNVAPFFGRSSPDSGLFYSDKQVGVLEMEAGETVDAQPLPVREGFSTPVLAAEDNPLLSIEDPVPPDPIPVIETGPTLGPTLEPPDEDDNAGVRAGLIAGIVILVALVILLAVYVTHYFRKKNMNTRKRRILGGPIPDIEENPNGINDGNSADSTPGDTVNFAALHYPARGAISAHPEGGASETRAHPPSAAPPDAVVRPGTPDGGALPDGVFPAGSQQWSPTQMYVLPQGEFHPGYAPGGYMYQGGYGGGHAFYMGTMAYGSQVDGQHCSRTSEASALPSALGTGQQNTTVTQNTTTWDSYRKSDGFLSPIDELETALDAMCDKQELFFHRYILLSAVERRVGGQGVVQFATITNTRDSAAIKFYLHRGAFESEKGLYMETQLKSMMPATLAIEDNAAGEYCTPYGYVFPPFVIIERGQSLDEWARDNKPDFITIFQALSHSVRALRQLHSIGYAHRDIKPGNILRRPKQHDWTLIDFGCTCQIGTIAPLSFSLKYSPPEVIHVLESGCKTIRVTAAVDIWAIGVIAFELLTGERAFPSPGTTHVESDKAAMDGLAGRVPLPWEASAPGAEERLVKMRGLRRTVTRCLERDPAQRPGAEQLLKSWDHTFDNMQTSGTDWSTGSDQT